MGDTKKTIRAEIPPQIRQQMRRFAKRRIPIMSDVERSVYGETPDDILHDPLLLSLQTPEQFHLNTWKEVAETYLQAARVYANKNNRHLMEIRRLRDQHQADRVEMHERAIQAENGLKLELKRRDGWIDQLKTVLHLLTDPRGVNNGY